VPTIKTCQECGQEFKARDGRVRFCQGGGCLAAHEARKTRQTRATWPAERKRAVHLTTTAIANGTLVRQPCEVCGTTRKIDAHHDDYSKPLEVRWLCRSHHRQHHIALLRSALSPRTDPIEEKER
jgi:hypothetical protein